MRDFFVVLKFELMCFFRNKSFTISTLILCLLVGIGLSVPTIIDTVGSFNKESTDGEKNSKDKGEKYGYVNLNGAISNIEDMKTSFSAISLLEFQTEEELEESIQSDKILAGYIIESPTKYQYIVKNTKMSDSMRYQIDQAILRAYKVNALAQRGIDYKLVEDIDSTLIEHDIKVLGKDSVKNYAYTYILVFGLYFIIILYGQLIATGVASEKSNRSMEVLVTSTKSTNLIFGKVIAGALAGILQFTLVLGFASIAYRFNAKAWDYALDFIFNIPVNVLLTFLAFGILGYLFYSFIYGALGALVSRTEDINASSTPITILFMVAFFIAFAGMMNPEGMLLKIASYVPFSSCMAMFVRVSMGSVTRGQVILAWIILAGSTIVVGMVGSMIYRMGMLMYGNPVKLKTVLKLLKE